MSLSHWSYIKRVNEKSVEAMDRFEAELASQNLRKPVAKARKGDLALPASIA